MNPRFLPLGDSALIIEYGERMDAEINQKVQRLAETFLSEPVEGIIEAVPTYRSVLLHYDSETLDYTTALAIASRRVEAAQEAAVAERPVVEIPVIYGGENGPDLEEVARLHGLSPAQVVRIHSQKIYRVYMIGFTPGFPYLGEVDEAIATPRLDTPRTAVPAGSVGIAGRQTGIYPIASPGGWRLLGYTPLALFDLSKDPPSLLAPGDRVRFLPVETGGAA